MADWGTMSAQQSSDINDLDRIFGYRGAIDDQEDVAIVAPEILMMPFWTVAMCSAVIEAAEALGEFAAHPDDPVPGHEVSLATISPRLYENLESDLGERMWPRFQEQWPLIDYCGLKDAFIIKYSLDSQTELRIHHDVAQVSASVKLNDDYEGARLDFPRQSFTNETVPVGSLLVWPSLVTHPHQTLPLVSGVKYGLTLWFEIPEQYS
jgi:hypothetical protein